MLRACAFAMAERQREQQKLWLILFQIKSIRARINSLAVQYFAFSILAIIVGGAAMVLTAALLLKPLWFLFGTLLVAVVAFLSVIRITRIALRAGASQLGAASLADD